MGSRQARTYPFLGLLFANLVTNVVLAKLASFSAYDFSDDEDPWLAYNRPVYSGYPPNSYHPPPSNYWYPLPQPVTYGPPPLATPISLTTTTTEPPVGQQQIVNINGFLPDDYYQDTQTNQRRFISNYNVKSFTNEKYKQQNNFEPIASESNVNIQHQTPQKSYTKRAAFTPKYTYKRGPPKRVVTVRYNRYRIRQQQKKKRYTTTPNYYDSYEEFTTTRYKPRRKNRPNYRRTTTEAYDTYEEELQEPDYDEQDEYEDSYEVTTKPYRRRKPNKKKKTKRPVYDNYDSSYENDDRTGTPTEAVSVRQRQETTTTVETTTTSSTTQSSSTVTTASSVNTTANTTLYGSSNGNENISITYTRPGPDYSYPTFTGYGPSNGNENISITYGPPSRLEYAAPYYNWYSPQTRANEIIGRVHDIVGVDGDSFNRRLT